MKEIISYIKNPHEYNKIGARLRKGINAYMGILGVSLCDKSGLYLYTIIL